MSGQEGDCFALQIALQHIVGERGYAIFKAVNGADERDDFAPVGVCQRHSQKAVFDFQAVGGLHIELHGRHARQLRLARGVFVGVGIPANQRNLPAGAVRQVVQEIVDVPRNQVNLHGRLAGFVEFYCEQVVQAGEYLVGAVAEGENLVGGEVKAALDGVAEPADKQAEHDERGGAELQVAVLDSAVAERPAAHAEECGAEECGYEGYEVQHIAQVYDAARDAGEVGYRAEGLQQRRDLAGQRNAHGVQADEHQHKRNEQAQYERDYLVAREA